MTKIYCYPRCTTCQKATKFLDTKSVEYELINIKENNPNKETLRSLWQKSGLELKKFFNTSGILYREMELSKKLGTMSDEEKLDLLATDGMLVKRPILITVFHAKPLEVSFEIKISKSSFLFSSFSSSSIILYE